MFAYQCKHSQVGCYLRPIFAVVERLAAKRQYDVGDVARFA